MHRSLLAIVAAPTAAAACLLVSAPAPAAETGQAPMNTYAPPPSYAPPPNYAPPPSYGAPPQNAPGQYAPPPQGGGGGGGLAANWDLAHPGWEVAGVLGLGSSTVFGGGLGLRVGYTFPQRIYVGGFGSYYFGGTYNDVGWAAWSLGAEIGYDIPLAAAPVLIRPYAGIGFEGVTVSGVQGTGANGCVPGGGCTGSGLDGLALWGGVVGTWNFTPHWFAGLDVRLVLPTFSGYVNGPGDIAMVFALTGGYNF